MDQQTRLKKAGALGLQEPQETSDSAWLIMVDRPLRVPAALNLQPHQAKSHRFLSAHEDPCDCPIALNAPQTTSLRGTRSFSSAHDISRRVPK